MALPAKDIESEALSLPVEDRTRLILHLLESIESRPKRDPREVERAWLSEANRRHQAYLQGEEESLPAEQVFSELRKDDH